MCANAHQACTGLHSSCVTLDVIRGNYYTASKVDVSTFIEHLHEEDHFLLVYTV